jgi:hypothetical protein
MTANIAGVGDSCNTRRAGEWSLRLPAYGDAGNGADAAIAVKAWDPRRSV